MIPKSKLVYLMVFFFGLTDAATTELGIGLGYPETRILGLAPFLATFIFFLIMLFVDWIGGDAEILEPWRVRIKTVTALVVLSPVLNNLAVLIGIYPFF